MLLSTGWDGCACRLRRRRTDDRGYFLVEALVLSFLLFGCAASVLVYQALAQNRASMEAEITAEYLAQEQLALIESKPASYLRTHSDLPWLGEGSAPVEKNRTKFEVVSTVLPHAATNGLAEAEVRIRWQEAGKGRETVRRKLVVYHD